MSNDRRNDRRRDIGRRADEGKRIKTYIVYCWIYFSYWTNCIFCDSYDIQQ